MSNFPPAPNQNYQPPFVQPPVKKSKVWLIVLLAVGFSLVAVVGLCVVGGLVFEYTKKELTVRPQDREVVLDIRKLESFVDDYRSQPEHETITKYRFLDGSHSVVYEYEDPGDEGIYLSCTVTVERKVSDAATTYLAESKGTEFGSALSHVDFVDRDDLFRWGDKSRFALIESEQGPGGNFFIARKGTRVFSLVVGGVYFDDGGSVRALLLPVLSRLEAYKP